ncbi:MAG TPA: HAD-IB family hydrolase [Gemmatimonadaceae bacterium]|nr:HAD-IB family hydrolase [Gemmatimonadaceae bacterium]
MTGARAAFYDLEGTLIRTNLVHALLFYAKRQRGLRGSLSKTAVVVAGIPLFAATNFYDRRAFNDLFFRMYAGQTEDRLRFFADELFDDVLRPAIHAGALDLLRDSRERGLRQVVITGALDLSVAPLMRHLEIDEWVANRLEFVDGVATGRVLPPLIATASKAQWMREFARREGIDLDASWAYTDSMSDLPMLCVVGHPAACNPDFKLRRTAADHGWPILDLS